MDRRNALRTLVTLASLAAVGVSRITGAEGMNPQEGGEYTLPPLTYSYDALIPVIDAETMELHYSAHHKGYVTKLNQALVEWGGHKQIGKGDLISILQHLDQVPMEFRQTIRNNGGGHANHSLFWSTMRPSPEKGPSEQLSRQLTATFGGIEQFKEKFEAMGTSHFGSGWVWLSLDADGRLDLASYPNQDCPAMEGKIPLIGNDLWEHAYYLSYRNRRAEYLKAWWKVVDWKIVEQRFQEGKQTLKVTGI